ncbi:MAG: 4-oxalocrotonate tautomerase [Pseudomonadota bacterium]
MPVTLTITEGLLPKEREQSTMTALSEAMLKLHGLFGNKTMTTNVIGSIQVVPAGRTFSGLKAAPVAVVDWLTPAVAFSTREIQIAYVKQATDIIYEACAGKHPRENIWVHGTHAVDGMWASWVTR